MPRFLLAHPEFYDVNYSINPWMNTGNKPDNYTAKLQWRRLFQLMITLGADIEVMNGHKAYPDIVFTANSGIVKDDIFIPSNFRYLERAGESLIFEKWFADNGYNTRRLPEGYYHEGAGDALMLGSVLIQAHGFRTNDASHSLVAELLNISSVSVELQNNYFYHLDTCFCPLINKDGSHEFIYFSGAFSDKKLTDMAYNKLDVPESEALKFVCNAVQVNDSVIISPGCEETTKWLVNRGYRVLTNDMSQFLLAGGSSKCCTIRIN